MILRTQHGNVELRSEWGQSSRIPMPWAGALSASGINVTQTEALGLPAVSNVIRSPAEIIASLPMIVYEQGDIRERAESSWQWKLLHDQPSAECDSFEFFYDLALSIEATQNAFIQKAKFRERVYELYVLDPQRVTVRQDSETGEKLFDVYVSPSKVQRNLTSNEILHIRGYTPQPGGYCGVSLLWQHRDPIGAAIAMQKFEGDYFRNSANSPFAFEIEGGNQTQAQALLDSYNAQHQGAGNQWRPTVVWGGTTVKPMPLSLQDALFADAKRLSIEDACRIWRWPKQLLELSDEKNPTDENAWTARFLKFYLLPRLKRIERAFAADQDLFPKSGAGSGRFAGKSGLFGEFLTSALERADFVTRVRGYKDARQGSWITANEIRKMENLPPVDGGDEILITPTGSAPNPMNEAPSSNGTGSDEAALEALKT